MIHTMIEIDCIVLHNSIQRTTYIYTSNSPAVIRRAKWEIKVSSSGITEETWSPKNATFPGFWWNFWMTRWWFQRFLLFHPYLGKRSDLTSIFFRWVVQPSTRWCSNDSDVISKEMQHFACILFPFFATISNSDRHTSVDYSSPKPI